jgi:hypothetical protein
MLSMTEMLDEWAKTNNLASTAAKLAARADAQSIEAVLRSAFTDGMVAIVMALDQENKVRKEGDPTP